MLPFRRHLLYSLSEWLQKITAAKEEKQQKRDKLRKRNVLAVRRGRETAGSNDSENSGDDCRNGGAAAEAAAEETAAGWDEDVWRCVLEGAGIQCEGSLEEFVLSEGRTDEMIGHWEKGVESLRSRLLVAQGLGGHQSIAVARGSAALRQEYEEMCWNGRHARFASFVSDVFAQEDSCSNSERLAVVGDEISELEERLQELRAKQQELQMEHQETEVTVSNLAWNVTSDMLRGAFDQIAEVLDAAVAYGEDGRSLGWAAMRFGSVMDAADAVDRFNGVELAGRPRRRLAEDMGEENVM